MRLKIFFCSIAAITFLFCVCGKTTKNQHYPTNPEPLLQTKLVSLPLGAVKPQGWLKDQLNIMANGLTGHLDEFWPDIKNSAWKGGGSESWERGPYYLDGLVPLAYILDDERLKEKAEPFIEWILNSQQPNGWFGPGKPWERWPLAVSGKVLINYYEATNDDRVIELLTNYFQYLHDAQPDWPDDSWRGMRAMENAVTGYWLYRRTQNPMVLAVIDSIHNNCYDWTAYYETFPWDSAAVANGEIPHNWKADGLTAHVVNNAMAFKYPGLWYQQSGDERFKRTVYAALEKYDKHHGQVGGRFSGDEHLSGKSPIQGTEMCAVVESMFSLEKLIEIFGDPALADRLELLAYNSLPGTMTPDGWAHQYDQQANQVLVSAAERDWSTNGEASNIYGLMPNYPCCLANMHQAWPKYTKHLWFATHDNGVAAMCYAPSTVEAIVGKGTRVKIIEETDYPFDGTIRLAVKLENPVSFPLYLRIPSWATHAQIKVGQEKMSGEPGTLLPIKRTWQNGDEVNVTLTMPVFTERRYNNSIAVRKGPLYFALRIGKEFSQIQLESKSYRTINYMGSADWQIEPATAWNYGLKIDPQLPENTMNIERFSLHEYPFGDRGDMVYIEQWDSHLSWQHEAPVVISVPAYKIPGWIMRHNSAGETPHSPVTVDTPEDTVTLVPYGCARLRIAEFPVVK